MKPPKTLSRDDLLNQITDAQLDAIMAKPPFIPKVQLMRSAGKTDLIHCKMFAEMMLNMRRPHIKMMPDEGELQVWAMSRATGGV